MFRNCSFFDKLGCVVRMVVDSMLPHAESRPNDHRKDAPLFITDDNLYKGCYLVDSPEALEYSDDKISGPKSCDIK